MKQQWEKEEKQQQLRLPLQLQRPRSVQLNAAEKDRMNKQWQINMIGKSNCSPTIASTHANQMVLSSIPVVMLLFKM